jgi:hypothetical protein
MRNGRKTQGGLSGQGVGCQLSFWVMTQKTARWWPGTLLATALMGVPSSALATVVWTADFEEGDLAEWTPGINNEGNVEVSAE